MSRTVEKCPVLWQCWRMFFKIPRYRSRSGWQFNQFFSSTWIHLWQNFHEVPVSSFYMMLLTDRQIDKRRMWWPAWQL